MRIKEIASFIEKCQVVVDIGSDHALLSTTLIDNNQCSFVYNLEKNEQPFLNSVKNTSKQKYLNKIINIKSDGFANFDSNLVIDYCVISGMGGKNIVDIISLCQNKVNYFLLCPNNNMPIIRNWAKKNNYKIVEEKTIVENKIYYEIILLSKLKGKKIFLSQQVNYGIASLKEKDLLYLEMLKQKANVDSLVLDKIKKNNLKKWKEHNKLLKYIRKYDNK